MNPIPIWIVISHQYTYTYIHVYILHTYTSHTYIAYEYTCVHVQTAHGMLCHTLAHCICYYIYIYIYMLRETWHWYMISYKTHRSCLLSAPTRVYGAARNPIRHTYLLSLSFLLSFIHTMSRLLSYSVLCIISYHILPSPPPAPPSLPYVCIIV